MIAPNGVWNPSSLSNHSGGYKLKEDLLKDSTVVLVGFWVAEKELYELAGQAVPRAVPRWAAECGAETHHSSAVLRCCL